MRMSCTRETFRVEATMQAFEGDDGSLLAQLGSDDPSDFVWTAGLQARS